MFLYTFFCKYREITSFPINAFFKVSHFLLAETIKIRKSPKITRRRRYFTLQNKKPCNLLLWTTFLRKKNMYPTLEEEKNQPSVLPLFAVLCEKLFSRSKGNQRIRLHVTFVNYGFNVSEKYTLGIALVFALRVKNTYLPFLTRISTLCRCHWEKKTSKDHEICNSAIDVFIKKSKRLLPNFRTNFSF